MTQRLDDLIQDGYIEIDMGKYGDEGQKVILRKPNFRMRNNIRNQMAREGLLVDNPESECIKERAADVILYGALMTISSAPFPITLEGFYDYCDKLDTVKYGNSDRFWADLLVSAKEIQSGDSPFVASPSREKQTSEPATTSELS